MFQKRDMEGHKSVSRKVLSQNLKLNPTKRPGKDELCWSVSAAIGQTLLRLKFNFTAPAVAGEYFRFKSRDQLLEISSQLCPLIGRGLQLYALIGSNLPAPFSSLKLSETRFSLLILIKLDCREQSFNFLWNVKQVRTSVCQLCANSPLLF